jgi:hypothetical protein
MHLLEFFCGNRFKWLAVGGGFAVFYFGKINVVFNNRNYIDFVIFGFEVAR